MKKRISSLILATSMLILSSTAAFAAQPSIGDPAETFYEGNKPFELAEKLIDELNADKDNTALFDNSQHASQYLAIKTVLDGKTDAELITALDNAGAIEHLCPDTMADYKKQYLVALAKAYADDGTTIEDSTIANGLKLHDTTGESLKGSFALLDDYVEEMKGFFNSNGIVANDYPTFKAEAKKFIAEPLIAILRLMFAKDKTDMRNSYYNDFLTDDRAKKTLAVLFGADLTEEIVRDSFLSSVEGSNQQNGTTGIVHHLKKYLLGNDSAIGELKTALADVMVVDKTNAINEAFDLVGDVVKKAYDHDSNADAALKADVKMLMGDGTDPGLVELMIKAVDNVTLDASNIWLNLFLSEFVQLNLVSGPLNTISAKEVAAKVELKDNASVTFKNEGLTDYGIIDARLPLNTGWFDVACYVEDATPGTYIETSHVVYSDGKIQITNDPNKGDTYDANLVLYRKDSTGGVDTFIESYPVLVYNEEISEYTGGGGGSTRYSVKYETNGGEAISSEYYPKGATVQLTKVPVREGYIFDGWYLDEALTQKVESVVMNGNITVYAKWTKDGSSVVSKVEVPDKLNGDEHFAYVIGYPEGDVRPQNNITRAEAVTILFRLLKDDVRNANVTDVNVFADVNEGDWYNKAVSTLAALEIVNGRTETEFMPDEYITRAEFATIFARFCEFSYTVTDEFKDIDGHWAENYINEAAAYGWIAGYEDNTFRPDNRITRAEAMTLINRVLKRNPENKNDLLEGMSVWTDNADTSAWYYIAVQEATNSHEYIKKNDSYEAWTKLTQNRDWTTYEK